VEKILFVVAADLEHTSRGIRVGVETQIACEKAILLHKQYQAHGERSLIIAAAGDAGKEWNNVTMSQVMKSYLCKRLPFSEVVALKAKTWNTDGEVKALVHHLRGAGPLPIVVCVKWWHAPRTLILLAFRLEQAGISIPIKVSWCRSEVSLKAILKEYCGAIPVNIVRIACETLKDLFRPRPRWLD
jgi:hypothetical protein